MEIERKWMVKGWPGQMSLLYIEYQEQGYIHTDAPIVRIRLESRLASSPTAASCFSSEEAAKLAAGGDTHYILCFKSAGLLSREEIEIEISREDFDRLSHLTGRALIRKVRRVYQLPEGLKLEVNLVDEGLPSEFMYAEVEFPDEDRARAWDPADCGLGDYLYDDVTQQPGQSMSAYWARTRKKQDHVTRACRTPSYETEGGTMP